ncbi:MAG: HYR domain-containing protein, partial [Verrucomicrobiota bacterium]
MLGPVTATDDCDGSATVTNDVNGTDSLNDAFPVGTTLVHWVAFDMEGNEDDCFQEIVVLDAEAPSMTCSSNLIVGTDSGTCTATVVIAPPMIADNCDTNMVATNDFNLSADASGVYTLGVTMVEWTVIDDAGFSNQCSHLVQVVDLEPPMFDCPTNVTGIAMGLGRRGLQARNAQTGPCEGFVNVDIPTGFDNCDTNSVVVTNDYNGTSNASDNYPLGVTTVRWAAVDSAGNVTSCTHLVTMIDVEAPFILNLTNINLTADPGQCTASLTIIDPFVDDQCSPIIVFTNDFTGTNHASGLYPVGTTLVEWVAIDQGSNATIQTQTVVVTDGEKPAITCPTNITVNTDPSNCTANVVMPAPVVSDNCDTNLMAINDFNGTVDGSDLYPTGNTIVIWTVTDAAGNSTNCGLHVMVFDNEAPSFVCPTNVTGIAQPGGFDLQDNRAARGFCQGFMIIDQPVVFDNCEIGIVASNDYNSSDDASGTYPLGVTTVRWSAVDSVGNMLICTQIVTMLDVDLPEIVNVTNISVGVDPGTCTATLVINSHFAMDDCSGLASFTNDFTGTNHADGVYPLGTTVVEWVAIDESGNVSNLTQTIDVSDMTAPVLACPSNITVTIDPGTCSVILTTAPVTATDDCDPAVLVSNDINGISQFFMTRFLVGTTLVRWVAQDISLNEDACTQQVVVVDDRAPFMTCPLPSITNNTDPGMCEALVTVPTPTVIDDCPDFGYGLAFDGSNDFVSVPSDPDLDLVSALTIEFWIRGSNPTNAVIMEKGPGNSWHFDLQPDGRVRFSISSSTGQDAITSQNVMDGDWHHIAATFSDVANRILIYVDGAISTLNNVAFDTPSASIMPVLIGSRGGLLPFEGDLDEIRIWNVARGPADILADRDRRITSAPGLIASYTMEDGPGSGVIADDSENGHQGTLIGMDVIRAFAAPGAVAPPPAVVNSVNFESTLSTNFALGTNVIIWSASDAFGNITNCTQSVVIVDNEPPMLSCPSNLSEMAVGGEGPCEAFVNVTTPVVSDNCDIGLVASNDFNNSSDASGTYPLGVTTVRWSVVDSAGLTATCFHTVEALDLEPPAIFGATNITVSADPGGCTAVVFFTGIFVDDECDGNPSLVSDVTGTNLSGVFTLGSTSLVWTAMDASGNSSNLTQTVTVVDMEPPEIICGSDHIESADNGCDINFDPDLPSITDNAETCGGMFTFINDYNGTSDPTDDYTLGLTVIEWFATDDAGNMSSCTQFVTVVDGDAPFIDCPSNITVSVEAGTCTATVVVGPVTAFDDCDGGPTVTNDLNGTDSLNEAFPVGTTLVHWVARDFSGNEDDCIQTIVVTDNEAPMLTCPTNLTVDTDVGSNTALLIFSDVTATDNCDTNVLVTNNVTGTANASGIYSVGVHAVTWTAMDDSTNSVSCVQTITVENSQGPTFVCPTNQVNVPTVEEAGCEAFIVVSSITATDDVPVVDYALDFDGIDDKVDVTAPFRWSNVSHTVSLWVKRRGLGSVQSVFSYADTTGTNGMELVFQADNRLRYTINGVDTITPDPVTDTNEWMHVAITYNDFLGFSFRSRFMTNGHQFSSSASLPGAFAGSTQICVGASFGGVGQYFDGCIDEVRVWSGERGPSFISDSMTNKYLGREPGLLWYLPMDDGPGNGTALDVTTNSYNGELSNMDSSSDWKSPGALPAVIWVTNNFNGLASIAHDFPLGSNFVLWSATDQQGNTTVCTQLIHVVDGQAPDFRNCTNVTVSVDPGMCGATVTFDPMDVDDDCTTNGVAFSNSVNNTTNASGFYSIGRHEIVWTAVDEAGNVGGCTQILTVVDDEAPVITCPADITTNLPPAACEVAITIPPPSVSDNCPGYALQFDGINDFVTPTHIYTNLTNNFTVEMWIRPNVDHEIDPEANSGITGTMGQRLVVAAPQGAVTIGPGH